MNMRHFVWGCFGCVIIPLLLTVGVASGGGEEETTAGISKEAYVPLMENEVLDVQDLAEGAEIQRRFFNRITPPGVLLFQPMMPSLAPFDSKYFDEAFLDGLLGEDKNSVAVYPLSLVLDPKTRETLIYNADGELIASAPSDGVSGTWPEDADPSRVTLRLDLLPAEDVEQYFYTEDRISETLDKVAAKSAKLSGSGGFAMRSLSANKFGIGDIQRLTNGNIKLMVSNGTDFVEIYAYTVVHTCSVVEVGWTNELGANSPTNVLWTPISPTYNGLENTWECLVSNLALTGGVGVWEDSSITTNDRVRFYGAAEQMDTDGDELTDGAELFVHHTCPTNADTDGDGHSDGREIALGTDPLDEDDYFGIVINAGLPINNVPANPGEWVELFNAGPSAKSLAGFRLQTAQTNGWTNVFTFPAGTALDSGDFVSVGTNGDFQAVLGMPDCSSAPWVMYGIRLVAPGSSTFVADALFYGFTNAFGFSMDGFGEELPIVRPKLTNVIRRTWIGYDTDHAGDWMNVPSTSWLPHTQGDYLDLDGDGLPNAEEIAGGIFPGEGGSRMDKPDSDADGLSDADEVANGTNPYRVDTDGDAFPWDEESPPSGNDADEVANNTDPLDADSDNDGIPDGWELASPLPEGRKSTGGGVLDPLSPASGGDPMPDGNRDSDVNHGDGIPNVVEVANLTNPFNAEDVDPRPYLWNGGDPGDAIDEGDIGFDRTLHYHIVTQPNSQPILVNVREGGYTIEDFSVGCDVKLIYLNPEDVPPTNRYYCIVPGIFTNFWFRIHDEKTTWPNESSSSYGADIWLGHEHTSINLDAEVPEESEESVGFLLADKSAHPGANRRQIQINNISGGDYLTEVLLEYDDTHLKIFGGGDVSNAIPSGTSFPVDAIPDLYAEGILQSGMQSAFVSVEGSIIPVHDRVTATVLKASIDSVEPLANRSLHPEADRMPLRLEQTQPENWNGLMQLSVTGAEAYWTPTGGAPIVLGETVFTNMQLPKTIYLEGDGCGEGHASFSVVGLSDCATTTPLRVFGVNATLAGVAELDEESPGGFIADHTVHTNAPRTGLALDACGPSGSSGDLVLAWDPAMVQIYTASTGGTALAQYSVPFANFNSTTLYIEGIAPGSNVLSWSYSEQTNCVDRILVTILKVDFLDASKNEITTLKVGKWENGFNAGPAVKDNFIGLDPDRFHVRVNDQSKTGAGKVSVKLLTDSDGTAYDDDATEIELNEEPANSGIFISTNMLMVSDDVDDDFTNPNVVADDTQNDRTHKITMGGKVKVQYPETGTVICEKEVEVAIEKNVDIHVVVLKNGSTILIGERFLDANDNGVWDSGETYRDTDGSGTYTTNLTEANAQARVEEELKVFKERYAQVGIKFNVTIEFKQAPTNVNDGLIELSPSSPNGDANLSADETTLLQAGLNSANANDIEVYYVKQSKRGATFTRGSSFPADWYLNMTTADLNDTFIIPNKVNYYSSSHEAYHIFSQITPHASDPVNIFYGTTAIVLGSNAQVTDSRRWSPSQETTMQTSAYAY